jgi:hypothetical protein
VPARVAATLEAEVARGPDGRHEGQVRDAWAGIDRLLACPPAAGGTGSRPCAGDAIPRRMVGG